jgi:hypothetical protein
MEMDFVLVGGEIEQLFPYIVELDRMVRDLPLSVRLRLDFCSQGAT